MRLRVPYAVVAATIACGREAPPAPPPTASAPVPSATASPASSPATEVAGRVAEGAPAPAFQVRAHDGAELALAALRGRPVVLYFYPRDETPGCTKEACAFRDAWSELSKTNVVLVGVSTDTDASHRDFAKHHGLPFHLVSDPDGALAQTFGVPSRGGVLARQTVVIGSDGVVKKIYRQVDVSRHASEILADLRP